MGPDIAAFVFCGLLGALALFQLMLAAGAPLGRFAWGGGHERLPARLRIGSLVAIVIYGAFALIALERAGLLSLLPTPSIAGIGIWIVAAYLALGVVMNAISRSKPERLTMTPLALVLCALASAIAMGPGPKG